VKDKSETVILGPSSSHSISVYRLQAGQTTRVQFPAGAVMGFFLFTTMSRLARGPTQPPIQWVLRALIPGVKQPGHEADH